MGQQQRICLPRQETQVWSLSWEDSLEKEMATHSRILAWKSHGQRSLVGYSPWDCKSGEHNLVTKLTHSLCPLAVSFNVYHEYIFFIIKVNPEAYIMCLLPISDYCSYGFSFCKKISVHYYEPYDSRLALFVKFSFHSLWHHIYRLVVLSLLLWHPVVSEGFMKFSKQI